MTSIEIAREAIRVLNEKKASGIKLLDIQKVSTLGDYFVIASGSSNTQVKALADEVEFRLKGKGAVPHKVEGHQSANWILLDYYDVMIHIFDNATRDFYSLERLWSDAAPVDISDLVTED